MTRTAQNWLDTKYQDKTVSGKIELFDKNVEGVEELTGELLIENYFNIEEIDLERREKRKGFGERLKGKITKVTIKNCPKLKNLNINNNEIGEVVFESDFLNLDRLDSLDNKLIEIDISKTPNLTWLNVARNPLTKVKGLEYSIKLKHVNLYDTLGFNGQDYTTQEKLDEAVKSKGKEFENHIDPNDKTKLETAAKNAGFGFTQKDIDDAVNKERENWKGYVDPQNYRVDWIDPKNLEEKAKEKGMVSAEDYNKILKNQKPSDLPEDWKQQIADKNRYLQERDQRPDISLSDWNNDWSQRKPLTDYNNIDNELNKWKTTFANQEPNEVKNNLDRIPELEKRPDIPITKQQWDDDYSKRPTQAQLAQEIQKEKDNYSNYISPEKLATDYLAKDKLEEEAKKIGMVEQADLDNANKKVQEYENGLKIGLELDDNSLPNWKAEIDKLKNRPTSDNSGPIKNILGLSPNDNLPNDWQNQLAKKDDLTAAQDNLRKWMDKFPAKTPNEVEKENKQAVDNLQKELNNWKDKFGGKTPETVAQELTEANQNKNKLNNWQTKFPNKSAEQVENEIKELKAKPAGTVLTSEQQQKLNDYDKVVKQRDNRPNITLRQYDIMSDYIGGKLGTEDWQAEVLGENWKAEIQQANK